MKKAFVFSRNGFNKFMKDNNINNENIPKDWAVVSIGEPFTKNCHYFKDADNVLNIDFWDVTDYYQDGYEGINDDQARVAYNFIKQNIGKDFYIHCKAGVSRSQAFGRFLSDCFDYDAESVSGRIIHENIHVLNLLKRCWRNDADI